MSEQEVLFHFVATHTEAEKLINDRTEFWIANCGCRESGESCIRSRIDVCLCFTENNAGSGTEFHKVSKEFVMGVMNEAKDKRLVARPFRDEEDMSRIGGICFCCDDCCAYFNNEEDKCDKGSFIEETDLAVCTHCGLCVEACYFDARQMNDSQLLVSSENCYGCGLCVETCPESCIRMIKR